MADTIRDDRGEQAKRAEHVSRIFEAAVKRVFASYAVEMIRPEGSARSFLHIRLVTDVATHALGWANPADGTAELYTLGHTLARSKARCGRELTLPPRSYARFLETAQGVLEDFGMNVTVVAFTCDDDLQADDDGPRRSATLPYLDLDNA